MRLFLDSGAFIAKHSRNDANHGLAIEKFKKILEGEIPVARMYTSDYVIGEAITVARVRASHRTAVDLGEAILNSKSVEKLKIDDEIFQNAWNIFKKYNDKSFSFVDCTSFALMESKKIKHVLTFDRHFDILGFTRI